MTTSSNVHEAIAAALAFTLLAIGPPLLLADCGADTEPSGTVPVDAPDGSSTDASTPDGAAPDTSVPVGDAAGDGDATSFACSRAQRTCDGACVDPATDPSNCGACANHCSSGQVCSAGICTLSCTNGLVTCTGDSGGPYCADTATDVANCGSCGSKCPGGQICSNGACAVTCAANLVECSGLCVDPASSNLYCGATEGCGTDGGGAGAVCDGGQVCSSGVCAVSCPAGELNCNGTCINPQTDRTFCGAAGACGLGDSGSAGTPCAAGMVCSAGSCAVSCQSGLVECAGVCVNPTNDGNYCGATTGCGTGDTGSAGAVCAPGQVCSSGSCQLTCQSGLLDCNGTCIDPTADRSYCGATPGCGIGDAGSAGATCGAGQVCSSSTCGATCASPLVLNNGACIDPTGITTCGATSNSHGADCTATGQICVTGNGQSACGCPTGQSATHDQCCPTGQFFCTNTCIDPSSNPQHCGATIDCGTSGGSAGAICNGLEACVSGSCLQLSCNTNVLLLTDNQPTPNAHLTTVLTTAGFTVTSVADGASSYDGMTPAAPSTYGAVLVIPAGDAFLDMPAAGQTAIVSAFAGGTGAVFAGACGFNVSQGNDATLATIELLTLTGGLSHTTGAMWSRTITHPVWGSVSTNFTVGEDLWYEQDSITNGGTVIGTFSAATFGNGNPAVAVKDSSSGSGRTVQFAHGASFGGIDWTSDANLAQLYVNAVAWAVSCN